VKAYLESISQKDEEFLRLERLQNSCWRKSDARILDSARATTCHASSCTTVDFVDTNVLIYAMCPGPGDMAKQELAANALERADLGLSAQVLQEFYWQVTHPKRPEALSRQDAGHFVQALTRFQVAPVTKELVRAAIATCMRFQIAYWMPPSSKPPRSSAATPSCPKT